MYGLFDHIIEAMAKVHGANPEYGAARPGIITQNGARICQHEWEFLVGNSVHKFSAAEVDAAVAQVFPPDSGTQESGYQQEDEPEETITAPAKKAKK